MGKAARFNLSGGTPQPCLEPLSSLSVELEAARPECISEPSEESAPINFTESASSGTREGRVAFLVLRKHHSDLNVWPWLRATGKLPCSFEVLILTLKSLGFLLFCHLIPLPKPQHSVPAFPGDSAVLVWNLITSLEAEPSCLGDCMFTPCEASRCIYGF